MLRHSLKEGNYSIIQENTVFYFRAPEAIGNDFSLVKWQQLPSQLSIIHECACNVHKGSWKWALGRCNAVQAHPFTGAFSPYGPNSAARAPSATARAAAIVVSYTGENI